MKTFAGFWQRVGAFALDYILILGYLAIVFGLAILLDPVTSVDEWLFSNRLSAQLTAFVLATLPITLYFSLSESSARQATWGKQRVGLQVIDSDGRRVGFWRAFARTLLKFVSWELAHTLVWWLRFEPQETSPLITVGFIAVYLLIGANIIALFVSKSRQTLYDKMTGTCVVRK